ncbi:DUF4865 family protein [Amycolatopsis pittospori]|uniref:DUF4865 family protein n=1 Tax=Amycolatopsis pittospori TaxID=2749434 RepID=UPI0015F02E7D|nr:DUF4865 family protein [Amycolatopsis pittospori]
MDAMQYEITLPADYDMGIIRERVATRGHLLDDFDGLGLKVYGIRERGVDGSTLNQYSPFYLWHNEAGMKAFLFGGPFAGIIDSFGRPPVQRWTVLGFEEGPAFGTPPVAAGKHVEPIPAEADPVTFLGEALDGLREHLRIDGAHSGALAVDPHTWQVVRYSLWSGEAPKSDEVRYTILHLSSPHLDKLRRGRLW